MNHFKKQYASWSISWSDLSISSPSGRKTATRPPSCRFKGGHLTRWSEAITCLPLSRFQISHVTKTATAATSFNITLSRFDRSDPQILARTIHQPPEFLCTSYARTPSDREGGQRWSAWIGYPFHLRQQPPSRPAQKVVCRPAHSNIAGITRITRLTRIAGITENQLWFGVGKPSPN